MALLEIRNLSYLVAGKAILQQLNLKVDEGEIHALIGTNGTGKSTLAQLIIGSSDYQVDDGDIFFATRKIDQLPIEQRARLGISMVWQEPARFEGITVRDYLALNKKAPLTDCLQSVGLKAEQYLSRMLDKTMSGGERKRIELASMLALRPRLCLLDEPISGIDLLSLQRIIKVIKQIQVNGSTILLISHREEIASIADRVSLLCGGKIIMTGAPETVVQIYKKRSCVTCDGRQCNHVIT